MSNPSDTLDRLREAAKEAARAGYYTDYLVSVVMVAIKDFPKNPDDERKAVRKSSA